MESRLTILIDNNKQIVVTRSLGSITITSKKYKGNINKLTYAINDFLLKNSISSSLINSITIICDISCFQIPANKFNDKIGYIQLIPSNKKYIVEKKKILEGKIKLSKIDVGLPNNSFFLENIKKAASYLNDRNINKIALNSYFSITNPEREIETVKLIKKFSKKDLIIFQSNSYKVSNYLLRGNYLLLNLIYYTAAKTLIEKIHETLAILNISCPIYFLKGDGTLIDETSFLNTSISTWFSQYTGEIMGCSFITNNKNLIVFSEVNGNIIASSIENYLPVLSNNFNTFASLRIPNFFPKNIQIKDINNSSEIKNVLHHLIVKKDEFLPIVNLTSIDNKQFSLKNQIFKINKSTNLSCIGASLANYKKEFVKIIFNTNEEKNNLIKKELLTDAQEFIKENKIKLKNINYNFEIVPLKYMKYTTCYIKLIIEGKIGNAKHK